MPTWVLDLIFNKYVLGALAVFALAFGAWYWHEGKKEHAINAAVEAALTVERDRLNAALDEARERIAVLMQEHAKLLGQLEADYKKEKEDAEARRIRDVAAARSGALRLRVPGTLCPAADGATVGAPSGSDGAASGELPGPVAADLFALVHDADQVVRQLTACQAVVRAQIETVNKEQTK